jgi:hypothetical protein
MGFQILDPLSQPLVRLPLYLSFLVCTMGIRVVTSRDGNAGPKWTVTPLCVSSEQPQSPRMAWGWGFLWAGSATGEEKKLVPAPKRCPDPGWALVTHKGDWEPMAGPGWLQTKPWIGGRRALGAWGPLLAEVGWGSSPQSLGHLCMLSTYSAPPCRGEWAAGLAREGVE